MKGSHCIYFYIVLCNLTNYIIWDQEEGYIKTSTCYQHRGTISCLQYLGALDLPMDKLVHLWDNYRNVSVILQWRTIIMPKSVGGIRE